MDIQRYFYDLMTDKANGRSADVARAVLRGASVIYGIFIQFIYWCYQKEILTCYKVKQPVISIGNITVGGVGKTPLVEYVAKFIKSERLVPAILLRGYMGEFKKDSFITEESDEAVMLRENLSGVPVAVGRNRVRNAMELSHTGKVDIFILDDGYQHWRLGRQLDIVVIDTTNPFGNGHLLPRGVLREPLRALARADIFVLTKTNLGEENVPLIRVQLKKINPLAPIVETIHQPVAAEELNQTKKVTDLFPYAGEEVCVFCSIGDPASFKSTLRAYAIKTRKSFEFLDHHRYSREDIEEIARFCRENHIRTVMTTQKDAVKIIKDLDAFGADVRVVCVKIKIKITHGEKELYHKLKSACRKNVF